MHVSYCYTLHIICSYPGLDIVAFLLFLRPLAAVGTVGGSGADVEGSVTRVRFGRRPGGVLEAVDEAGADGDVSAGGTLRFRLVFGAGWVEVGWVGGGAGGKLFPAVFAALAEDRVTLDDMICEYKLS